MSSDMTDGLGLGKLGDFDLSAMLEPATEKYRDIDIDLIREDGENPRRKFNEETLAELAETIKSRGVISPISVRPDPDREDGYIVNHGHRRLRASRLAGRATIPAVIDENFHDEDRIIENIQRDNLDMFEVAAYIRRKLDEGLKQKDVAARIGKSTAYVSNHVQLLELPNHTAKAVDQGRVADVTTINELIKLERQKPDSVSLFLAGDGEVTRTAVRNLRSRLETAEPASAAAALPADLPRAGRDAKTQERDGPSDKEILRPSIGDFGVPGPVGEWRRGLVVVERDGKRGMLQLDKRPRSEKHVWVEWEEGEIEEERLDRLTLLAVVSA